MANKYSCSNSNQLYLLNQLCTNGSDSALLECYKNQGPMTDISRLATGIWHISIAFIGIFGNVTTLIALPYAAKRKRHGIDKGYGTTTVFLLHLSFVDLLHCLLMAIPRGMMYLKDRSPFGIYGCQIVMYAGMSIFLADMVALALVALSRCLDTVLTMKWTEFCGKRRNRFMLFLLTWAIGLLVIPVMLAIHSYGIEMGWNCETGGCGFIRNCRVLDSARQLSSLAEIKTEKCSVPMEVWRKIYVFIFFMPIICLIVIIFSYLIIFYKVHVSKRNFSNEENTFDLLRKRQMKMTCTTLLLIVLNVLFWTMAFVIIAIRYDEKLSDSWKPMSRNEYAAYSIFVNVFEVQYALNFFVYIFRSDQYRSAFIDIFKSFANVPFSRTNTFNERRMDS